MAWLGQFLLVDITLVTYLTDAHCCHIAQSWTVTIKFHMHAPMHCFVSQTHNQEVYGIDMHIK
jgi:hypothetical protein